MNPFLRIFFDFMLTRNLAFMLFFAVLATVLSGRTVKQTFTAGLKWAAAILFGKLAAAALYALIPAHAWIFFPTGVLVLTLLLARWLKAWGELDGEWAGLPREVVAYVPLAGSMWVIHTDQLAGMDAVAAAFGGAAGVYFALVAVVSLIEQIRISEAPPPCRRLGALLFAIALFALAFSGFHFF